MNNAVFALNTTALQTCFSAGEAPDVMAAHDVATLADDFPWHRIRRLYRK